MARYAADSVLYPIRQMPFRSQLGFKQNVVSFFRQYGEDRTRHRTINHKNSRDWGKGTLRLAVGMPP